MSEKRTLATMRLHIVLIALSSLLGAASNSTAQGLSAKATLNPTSGNTAAGTVTFTQQGEMIQVVADLTGLTPGPHGFHIHETGDCSAADAASAGGHFNPTAMPHAHPGRPAHHAGDLPMLVANESGKATLITEVDAIALGTGPNDVIGKSVIVHMDADDFKTQPAGNSGARIACGVIARQ